MEAGDMGRDVVSGMRPSFNLDDNPITSVVHSATGAQVLARGARHEIVIMLPYGEILDDHLRAGSTFRLQVGGRLLATGEVVQIMK